MGTVRRRVLLGGVALVGAVALPLGLLMAFPATLGRPVQRAALVRALGQDVRVQAPAGTVRVIVGGPERASPVALIHGFGDAAAGWLQVATALAERHRVAVPDLAGHGASEPAAPPVTWEHVRSGLLAQLDAVDPDQPWTLVGNSMGGWLAWSLALERPERVARVVLVNNAGLDWPIDRRVLIPRDREAARTKNLWVLGEHDVALPGFMVDDFVRANRDPRLDSLFDSVIQHFMDPATSELQVPVELVWGIGDGFFPHDTYGQRMMEALPGATMHLMPGCGHAPQYSCPDELVALLQAMLGHGVPPG